eukprot:83717-Prorocentrum_minimum.AAC.4
MEHDNLLRLGDLCGLVFLPCGGFDLGDIQAASGCGGQPAGCVARAKLGLRFRFLHRVCNFGRGRHGCATAVGAGLDI